MPVGTVNRVCHNIGLVIKRFKFEELESAVMPVFPETTWSNVKSELVKQHNAFSPANVAKLLIAIVTDAKVEEKVLRDRLSMLKLIDVSWHSNRRLWYGYLLQSSDKPVSFLINQELQSNINHFLKETNKTVTVKVTTNNGITFVSLTEGGVSKTRRKSVEAVSYFFALFAGQNFFFCTRKDIKSYMLQVVVESLGCKKAKKFNLIGKDLRSLCELIWKKRTGIDSESFLNTVQYKDAAPVKTEKGTDFTQQEQRTKYANKCFGESPPTLEMLVINCPRMPLLHDISTELSDKDIQVTWEFRSHNIATCFTRLIEKRILVPPVPYYISNLMMLGKNKLMLKNN